MIREIKTATFDDKSFTDQNSLARLGLSAPDWLSRKMTYQHGKDRARQFSFLASTEGAGNVSYKDPDKLLNDVMYKWPVMGRMRHTVEVVTWTGAGTYTQPGIGNSSFKVIFTDRWGIRDYGLLAPDGVTQVQIIADPKQVSTGYEYTLQLRKGDPTAFVALRNLAPGASWVMIAPKVSEAGSVGNEHRKMSAGEMVNQISFDRYTMAIKGNLANKTVIYEFTGSDTMDGSPTNLWINEEQRQFDVWVRTMKNHDLYIQEYNRNALGEIALKYFKNGDPIPIGSGVRETIQELGIYVPHSGSIPVALFDNIITTIISTNTDTGTMHLEAHGGTGLGRLIHQAMLSDATSNTFTVALGEKWIKENGKGLTYGNTFTTYATIEGHTFTYINDTMFDDGLFAELDKKNNRTYLGLPFSSYNGVIIDKSTRDGQVNFELAAMKGQTWISGIYQGMSPIPPSWMPGNAFKGDVKLLSTDADETSYHVKTSCGVNIKDSSRCVLFEFVE